MSPRNDNDSIRGHSSTSELLIRELSRLLRDVSSTVEVKLVSAIVTKTITLALHMAEQHCRLQIVYPRIGDQYPQGKSPPEMISIPASEDATGGRVAFIVNPSLTKWGDAYGENLVRKPRVQTL
jgi:hypothetical protein